MHKYITFSFVVRSFCNVSGWGYWNEEEEASDHLRYAEVPIRNITECRTQAFIEWLSYDLIDLGHSNKSSELTWEHIRQIGKDSQFMHVALKTGFKLGPARRRPRSSIR